MSKMVRPKPLRPHQHNPYGGPANLKLDPFHGRGRMRNDSGCFEDDHSGCSSASSTGSPPEFKSAHWDELVSEWAGRNHTIIAQEAVRMKQMTEYQRVRLSEAKDPRDQERVVHQWQQEMADIMAFTQDLIQCIVNDVSEKIHQPKSEPQMSSQDLGRIIEEELANNTDTAYDADESNGYSTDAKLILVRTKKKQRRNRSKRGGSRGKRSPARDIRLDDGAVFRSEDSFTIQVDQVQRDHAAVLSGSWQWRKDLESPLIWSDDDDESSLAGGSEVEDIFADWLELLQGAADEDDLDESEMDIKDAFWSLATSQQGPMSAALPDILRDRCELLEGEKRRSRRFKKVRPKKTYWNIFNDWKFIFREEQRAGVKKKRHRKRPHHKKHKKGSRAARPKRASLSGVEDYFHDFIGAFQEVEPGPSRRRRSTDLNPKQLRPKRMRLEEHKQQQQQRRNWHLIHVDKHRTFDDITHSIERKIREAIITHSDDTLNSAANACCGSRPLPENFNSWPKQMARRIRKSRKRFEKLRCKMHKMRETRRRSFDLCDEMDAFEQWNWNLADPEPQPEQEDVFSDFCASCGPFLEQEPDMEDFFQDWRLTGALKSDLDNPKAVAASTVYKSSHSVGPLKLQLVRAPPPQAKTANRALLTCSRAIRRENQLRMKSFAKQPRRRGANYGKTRA